VVEAGVGHVLDDHLARVESLGRSFGEFFL
jgi:hypothetical protein